jgi:murein L,D-transpeptidase YcbB/YkuD
MLGVCLCLATGDRPRTSAAPITPGHRGQVQAALVSLLAGGDLQTGFPVAQPLLTEVRRLYALRGMQAVWLDDGCRPGAAMRAALGLIGRAADDGLVPEHYAAAEIAVRAAALSAVPCASPEPAARLDAAVSAALLRYMRHLHLGRVDPRALDFRVTSPPDDHDLAAMLHEAVAAGRVREMVAALAPVVPPYARLREALRSYRALAARPDLLPWRTDAAAIRPGDNARDLPALAGWLAALGDLPAADRSAVRPDVYEGVLADAVARFQRRHGLAADGVIGRDTRAALATPLDRRVRQIELALERLRWLPHPASRLVVVNIPMFRLVAIDVPCPTPSAECATPPRPVLESGVVVGKALNTRTPVFDAWMTHVIFRPYWNVPRSILRNELLPQIRRTPAYLARNDLEIVRGQTDEAVPVPATPENLEALAAGALRLRQRPGPGNSLGLIKFVFPNAADVYLHDTPARSLFERARRDFSHGCVRVERPLDLAEWLLGDDPAWTRERIEGAMQGAPSRRADLRAPVQVLLFYLTALASPDGTVQFADDIYKHDARLEHALAAR